MKDDKMVLRGAAAGCMSLWLAMAVTPAAEAQVVPGGEGAPPPTAAPGAFEVDEDEVTRALERALVLEGGQLLSSGVFQIQPGLSYSLEELSAPFQYSTEEGEPIVGERRIKRSGVTTSFTLRAGLPYDSQIDVTLPYRIESTTTEDRIGFTGFREASETSNRLGDIRVGLSKSLVQPNASYPSLVGGLYWDTDSDDMGTTYDEVGATLTTVIARDPLVFIAGLNYERAFEKGGVQPGDTIGLSAAVALAVSPEASLRIGLEQNFRGEAKVNGQEIRGSETSFGLVSLGVSTILPQGKFLDINAGIGITESAPDLSVSMSMPIRLGAGRN